MYKVALSHKLGPHRPLNPQALVCIAQTQQTLNISAWEDKQPTIAIAVSSRPERAIAYCHAELLAAVLDRSHAL